MSDIKNKIIDLFNDIEKKNISYEDLKFILESILDNNVDKNEVYSFLDLLHLSNVSKIISKRGDIDFWAMQRSLSDATPLSSAYLAKIIKFSIAFFSL